MGSERRARLPHRVWRARTAYLFLVPFAAFYAAFSLWPIILSIKTSFYRVGPRDEFYIGLDNYKRMLDDSVFATALKNTLLLALGVVPFIIVTSLVVAVIAVQFSARYQSFVRMAFYLPAVASSVVLSLVWLWILNPIYGLLNYLIGQVGVEPKAWLGDESTALVAVMLVLFSFSLGPPVILFIAGINAIPPELYEAARIDGAGSWREFWHITMPLIRPTTTFVFVVTTIGTFQTFSIIQILTAGGPANSTQTIVYQIYQTGFVRGDFGYAAALSTALLLISYAFAIVQIRLIARENVEY